jgi:hypothetical protein
MILDLLTVFGGFGLFLKLPRSEELELYLTKKNMQCSKKIKKSDPVIWAPGVGALYPSLTGCRWDLLVERYWP